MECMGIGKITHVGKPIARVHVTMHRLGVRIRVMKPTTRDSLWLELQFPDRPTEVVAVPGKPVVQLGRHTSSDVVIPHSSVSRAHAELTWCDGAAVLKDCGSKNGTYVDRSLIDGDVPVETNCWLRFGDVVARLHDADSVPDLAFDARSSVGTLRSFEVRKQWLDTSATDLARSTLQSILELSGYTRGFILLLRADGFWTVKASVMLDSAIIERWEFTGSRTAIGTCVAERRPIVHNNVAANRWIAEQESVIDGGIQAILCLPMRMDDALIGVVYADDQKKIPGISHSDLEILESLTSHAAMLIALENLEASMSGFDAESGPAGSDWLLAPPDPTDRCVLALQQKATG